MVSVCKAFLPLLKRTKGRIVNIASMAGRIASPCAVAYCISKFGVEAFSDSLHNEVKHLGITVHIIEPGMFKTNIYGLEKNHQCLQRLWENLDTDTRESYGTEYYEQVKALLATVQKMASPHTYKVVNAMAHAVTSTQPKLQYVVGWDAKLLSRPLSFLPSEVQDLVHFFFPKPKGIPDHK